MPWDLNQEVQSRSAIPQYFLMNRLKSYTFLDFSFLQTSENGPASICAYIYKTIVENVLKAIQSDYVNYENVSCW